MVTNTQPANNPQSPCEPISKARQLLSLQADMRRQPSFDALCLWAVNEPRWVLCFAQAIFARVNRADRVAVTAISSLPGVDRNAPFVRALEKRLGQELTNLAKGKREQQYVLIDLVAQAGQGDVVLPFSKAMLAPLRDTRGRIFALYVVTRQNRWTSSDELIFCHLIQSLAHAFLALAPRAGLRRFAIKNGTVTAIAASAALSMFIPVSMTTLAPAEIVADAPVVVTAPIDGVVSQITRPPNAVVKKGDVLVEFDPTALEADAEVARRREWVARARLATARSTAFSDATANRELATARAEVDLAQAERRFAEQKLARARVTAPGPGHLIYSARKDWSGRPVKVGEKIMEIADLNRVAVRIDLPVSDAIALKTGAPVRLFLDSNPLSPLAARVRRASYEAKERAGVGLVYEVVATLKLPAADRRPRIGLRGTAQIRGEKVALGFFLFRKPIASLRQFFGI